MQLSLKRVKEIISKEIELPLVSIILPSFNRGGKCITTIKDILKQTYKNFELIIINDGSDIYSSKLIEEYISELKDNRIHYFKQNNKGLSASLNFGLEKVKGEYITWISDDNKIHFNFIEKMIQPKAEFSYSDYNIFYKDGQIFRVYNRHSDIKDLINNFKGMASFMWKKTVMNRIGKFNINLSGLVDDYDYEIRTFLNTNNIVHVDEALIDFYVGEGTQSHTNYIKMKEVHKIVQNFYNIYIDNFFTLRKKCMVNIYNTEEIIFINNEIFIPQKYTEIITNLKDTEVVLKNAEIVLKNTENISKNTEIVLKNINTKLITVILPTLGRIEKFKKTVSKFLNQTCRNFELIIFDDGSSEEIVKEKETFLLSINDNRLRFYKNNVNLKIPKTLNKGLKLAKGEFVTWISDDNDYYDIFLENLYDDKYDYVYSYFDHKILINEVVQTNEKQQIKYQNIAELLRDENGKWIGSASFMWRKSFLNEIYGWGDDLHGIEDYEIIFKTYLYTRSIKHVSISGMCYHTWKNYDEHKKIEQNSLYSIPDLFVLNQTRYEKFKDYYYNNLYKNGTYKNNSEIVFPSSIPKIAFAFWYGDEFTYLHLLALETFCFYNRDFKFILYTIEKCNNFKWKTGELGLKINCKNYFDKLVYLQKIYNIEIVYLTKNEFNYSDYPPNIISDLVRWAKLYEHGGVWIDLDIIFMNPIEFLLNDIHLNCNINEVTFIVSNYKNVNGVNGWTEWWPCGVLFGSKNNTICKNIITQMNAAFNENDYNSVGPNLAKKNFRNYQYFFDTYKKVGIFEPNLLYPYVWYQVDDYFNNYNIVDKETCGLHWYNGHEISRKYLNNMHKFLDNDKSFFKTNKTCVEIYIEKFLKIKSNAQKSYIICLVIDSYGWALDIFARNIKYVLGEKHTIFIYTTNELLNAIQKDHFDTNIIDLFVLLNSYDPNVFNDESNILVNYLPNGRTINWICDYCVWTLHPNEKIRNNGKMMMQSTVNNSMISLQSCKKIEQHLQNEKIIPKKILYFPYTPDLNNFKFNKYEMNIYTKRKLIVGWAGNASPDCHGWLKGLDNIKNVLNKLSDKFELIYHNKYEGNGIEYKDMYNFYNKIDIYVCFSKYEGSPNTILEASTTGKAWISTDVGNIPEMLTYDSNCGIMIERDENVLEQTLLHLYDHRNQIVQMGSNARKVIETHFDSNKIICDVFREIFKTLNF